MKLSDIETSCIKVERNYRDLINNVVIQKKSEFIEKLTHDSYIVQVDRITDRYQTRLDKLLSLFEQKYFTDETKITKEFPHQPDTEEVKLATDLLHFTGTNPEERRKIEIEQEAWRTVNAMFEDKEKEYQKKLDEKDRLIEQLRRQLNERQ